MLLFSELKKRNLLSNESMSNVRGGGGTCGFKSASGIIDCGVSKDDALRGAGAGGNWCCDSCGHSSYCSGYPFAEFHVMQD